MEQHSAIKLFVYIQNVRLTSPLAVRKINMFRSAVSPRRRRYARWTVKVPIFGILAFHRVPKNESKSLLSDERAVIFLLLERRVSALREQHHDRHQDSRFSEPVPLPTRQHGQSLQHHSLEDSVIRDLSGLVQQLVVRSTE
jgi:hypothetical protein